MDFYKQTIESLVANKKIDTGESVLAVCAGTYDRDVFTSLGFDNVTISNLDYHGGVEKYDPYPWRGLDAEALELDSNSFDWVVVHAGLHHCISPHNALCEMMRVARKGVVVFESRDSFLVRLAVRFGLTVEYELEPIAINNGKSGGVRNTPIPNYIYRWTEREITKVVQSFSSVAKHEIHFFYGFTIPTRRLAMSTNPLLRSAGKLANWITPVFGTLAPRQGNRFGVFISFSEDYFQWLQVDSTGKLTPNLEYMASKFNKDAYN